MLNSTLLNFQWFSLWWVALVKEYWRQRVISFYIIENQILIINNLFPLLLIPSLTSKSIFIILLFFFNIDDAYILSVNFLRRIFKQSWCWRTAYKMLGWVLKAFLNNLILIHANFILFFSQVNGINGNFTQIKRQFLFLMSRKSFAYDGLFQRILKLLGFCFNLNIQRRHQTTLSITIIIQMIKVRMPLQILPLSSSYELESQVLLWLNCFWTQNVVQLRIYLL